MISGNHWHKYWIKAINSPVNGKTKIQIQTLGCQGIWYIYTYFIITIDETACKRKTSIYFPRMSGVIRDGGFGEGEDGQ